MNWTTNDAVATEILYMGLANLVNTEVRLVSFNATRYPRGVLLQWKTGLRAGQPRIQPLSRDQRRPDEGQHVAHRRLGPVGGAGDAVNSALSYALWDLDQASAADGVTYWLEDLDLNGKITRHGPIVRRRPAS